MNPLRFLKERTPWFWAGLGCLIAYLYLLQYLPWNSPLAYLLAGAFEGFAIDAILTL